MGGKEHSVRGVMCEVIRGSECSDSMQRARKTKARGEPLGALDLTTRMFQSIFIIDGEQMITSEAERGVSSLVCVRVFYRLWLNPQRRLDEVSADCVVHLRKGMKECKLE